MEGQNRPRGLDTIPNVLYYKSITTLKIDTRE